MLKKEVISAAEKGRFHIYAIETMDEGIEILTSIKAGTKNKEGKYQKNSINYLVMKRLKTMSESVKESEKKTKRKKRTKAI
jgi:hypothetical protein